MNTSNSKTNSLTELTQEDLESLNTEYFSIPIEKIFCSNLSTELTQEDLDLIDSDYSNEIIWSSKTPKTFKVSLNLTIMKMKKLYWYLNTSRRLH